MELDYQKAGKKKNGKRKRMLQRNSRLTLTVAENIFFCGLLHKVKQVNSTVMCD